MRPVTARAAAAFTLAVAILAAVSFLAQAHPQSSTDVIGEGDALWDRGILLVDKGRWAEALLGTRKLHKDGALFVIGGHGTFSAAMNFAAQLERHAVPMFAGEPTGSSPNFIGENSELTLPYSKLHASISNLYWQNGFPQDHRTWIAPLLHAPPTLASLVAGRDPALEAIRAYISELGSPR